MVIENGLRNVHIAPNTYAGETTFIACYFVQDVAVRSRTFKTERGAVAWGTKQVRA